MPLPASLPRILLLLFVVVGHAFAPTRARSQEPANRVSPAESAAANPPSLEDIDEAIKQVDAAKDLEDPTKRRIKENYQQAVSELETAEGHARDMDKFKAWIKNATNDLQQARNARAAPVVPFDKKTVRDMDLDQLNKNRSAIEEQLSEAKKKLAAALIEPQRRLTRRADISVTLAKARTELEEVTVQLQSVGAEDGDPLVSRSRSEFLQTRKHRLTTLLLALEAERGAYEAQQELPRLEIDLAQTNVNRLETHLRAVVQVIADRRRQDAATQKEDAVRAFQDLPELLRPQTKRILELADRRIRLASEIQTVTAKRERTGRELKRWQQDFARIAKRADSLQSNTIGLILIEKRASFPSSTVLRNSMTEQESKLRSFQKELYQLEDRRVELSDVSAATKQEADKLSETGSIVSEDVVSELESMLKREVQILDSLLVDANRNYSLRIATTEDEQKLMRLVQSYREFVDSRVFWVRSCEPLQVADLKHALDATSWLCRPGVWRNVGSTVRKTVEDHTIRTILFTLLVVGLAVTRRFVKRRVDDLGKISVSKQCLVFQPTLQTLGWTIVLSAPIPLLCWGFGQSLSSSSLEQMRAVSLALTTFSTGLLFFEFIRQTCRPSGLAESHFGCEVESTSLLRRSLRFFIAFAAPLTLITMIFEVQRNPLYQASLGRFALIGFQGIFAWTSYRLLKSQGRPLARILEESASQHLVKWFRALYPIPILLPLALSVLAVSGLQYTSFRITIDHCKSCNVAVMLWILGACMFRWVHVKRRGIRRLQLLEARQRARQDDASELSELDEITAQEEKVDLVAIDHQTRRLIAGSLLGVAILGLTLIWYQDLPALTPLFESELWYVVDATGATQPISLGRLMVAAFVAVLTIMASRDIPGVIDVMLLGKLEMQAATRYAISTLSQYGIVFLGAFVACHLAGITWSKAQWLVAALSVGLGFGLQEIVANFVCGILVLFERPIRVGDVVTLGDTTGIVVRIRSRATTVRNWDRQEVIIPNKELITGRIVNWTLSDKMNRIVIQVGVAYGSDVERVRTLLQQIAGADANVLDDPRPLVVFEQFADSSLNFSLRAYLDNVDERMETIHNLHVAINSRFAAENVEISFPQRDLHIRSMPNSPCNDQIIPNGTTGEGDTRSPL